jgi:phosphoesterase RecJ-like protein
MKAEERSGVAEALDRAGEVLACAPAVALVCHVNPDPDAIGSMYGLALFLASRGVEVVCSWPNEPLEPPRWIETLSDVPPTVRMGAFPKAPDVLVALDTASLDRLGGLEPNLLAAARSIVLDHHATNPGFGGIVVLDPTAASTAEIAYRLIRSIGGDLPNDAAACLYAGVVTDTGRFQYEAAGPETLRMAAELRGYRFDHARLAQYLFEDNSLPYLRLLAAALERLEHIADANMLWTHLSQADLARTGVPMTETDDLIDVIRTAREADVACVIKEQRDGRLKVSLRSRGATDVGSVAGAFGGGGHRLAAGYTSRVGLEETIAGIVASLKRTRSP